MPPYNQKGRIFCEKLKEEHNCRASRFHYAFGNAHFSSPANKDIKPLTAKNSIPDGSIPDVSMSHPQATAIYKLYRAGIVQGSDGHKCKPDSNIKRSEVSAILTRMLNAEDRISFSLAQQTAPGTDTSALTVIAQPEDKVVSQGADASSSVQVSGGTAPYTFEWYYRNADSSSFSRCEDAADWYSLFSISASGATATLTVKNANEYKEQNGSRYYCIITDADGSTVQSRTFTLTVSD